MFKKAQLKLTIVYTLILIGILLATNVFIYFGLLSYNNAELSNDMERIIRNIQGTEWIQEDDEDHEETHEEDENKKVVSDSYELDFPNGVDLFIPEILNSFSYFFIYDNNGEILRVKSSNDSLLSHMFQKSEQIGIGEEPLAFDLGDYGYGNYIIAKFPIMVEGETLGHYTIVENVSIAFDTLSNLRLVMINVMIVGSVVSLLIGYVLAGITMRPIKSAYLVKQRFVGDAAHELRTPISVILLSMETIKRFFAEDNEELNEIVDDVVEEANNMKELVKKLLFLARSDSGSVLIKSNVVDMTTIIDGNIRKYEQLCMDKGITLKSKVQDDLKLYGDKKLLDSVVSILIDNAIKYNNPNGYVEVEAKSVAIGKKHFVEVSVKDNGIGIKSSHIDKIFERFHRQDISRSKRIQGYGLGLSIAETIVKSHGGTIKVDSEENVGSTFTFTIAVE
ncbi:ATP-binding protein [Wukongibacter baidiensis]|uniref:sensor histidine kinase n=1 Tax=Wukongibacter baidiensis TaxID=1723361 RepID=UPI003D7F3FEE